MPAEAPNVSIAPGAGSSRRSWARHVLILIAAQLAIGLPYLRTVPRIYIDDAWETSLGRCLAYEGVLRHGIIEGWGGIHVRFVQDQMIQPLVLAALYRVFGFGMLVSRVASVLVGAAAIVAV